MYTSPYIMTTPIVMPVLRGVVPPCVCRARGARSEGRSAISDGGRSAQFGRVGPAGATTGIIRALVACMVKGSPQAGLTK